MNGVVAAGHPLTAEAGAEVLREGGNAVDAAVGAVLTSFAVESPLTGFGAGGFMMVHRGGETVLFDFFVAAPGKDGVERGVELAPVPVHFDADTVQTFYVGPASCGVPGTAAGLELALRRFGSAPLADLAAPGIRLAREGAPVNAEQAYILEILWPIHERLVETRELYAPDGRQLGEGDVFRFPELAEALERFGAEGAEPFYRGEVAAALSGFMAEHGGTLGTDRPGGLRGDRAAADPRPVPGRGGADQPAPLLGRDPDRLLARPAGAARRAQRPRAVGRRDGRRQRGRGTRPSPRPSMARSWRRPCSTRCGARPRPRRRPARLDHPHLGPRRRRDVRQRHLLERLRLRRARPRHGVILNNMLGEEDLNPLGFHAIAPGAAGALDDGADRGPARR